MKTKEIAKEMIEGVKKEERRRIKIYDDDFRDAVIDALEKENHDYSDEEIEDFVGDCESYFIEMAQNEGFIVDFVCNGIVVIKE